MIPATHDAAARRLFRYMWRNRHHDDVAWRHVMVSIADPASSSLVRACIEEETAALMVRHALLVEELLRLRSSLRGVSVLLARLCEHEGLSLAAVAYGVLPGPQRATGDEDHPWRTARATGIGKASASRRRASGRSSALGAGAIVRPSSHERGAWVVRQERGALLPDFVLDGCRVRCYGDGIASMLLPAIPEAICACLPGRRLGEFVDHPVLSGEDHVIEAARTNARRTLGRFSSPILPVRFDDLRPPEPGSRHQLGRDGSRSGADAVADVLARGGGPNRSPAPRQVPADLWSECVIDRERLLRTNLMAPPWCERLPVPEVPRRSYD